MSYDSLAAYYDALVKDEEATAAWLDYTPALLSARSAAGAGVRQRRDFHRLSQGRLPSTLRIYPRP